MAEEERPYHIQAIYDLKADYSPEYFRSAIAECRKVIAQAIAEDNSSDQQVARVRILRYLDLQLSRAVRWAEDEADLMAVVLRSQIELRSWADFVSAGPKEAAAFARGRTRIENYRSRTIKLIPRSRQFCDADRIPAKHVRCDLGWIIAGTQNDDFSAKELLQETLEIAVSRDQDETMRRSVFQNPPIATTGKPISKRALRFRKEVA